MDKKRITKTLATNGISSLSPVTGTSKWYWGSDYFHGDLYEAEEIFEAGHEITSNRLILVKYPEGIVIEPIKPEKGAYFGNVVYENGKLFILHVHFEKRQIMIKAYDETSGEVSTLAQSDKSIVTDCYNLMLQSRPLFLSREARDGKFQILWPDQSVFATEETETIYAREDDILISNVWFEDPNYREEMILRHYPSGEIIDRKPGTLMDMPDGQRWLLT